MKAAPFTGPCGDPSTGPCAASAAPFGAWAAWWRTGPLREVQAAVLTALLTLVTVVPYASVAGAPLGPGALASAVLSGLIGATVGALVAAALWQRPAQICSPRASVCLVVASAVTSLHANLGGGTPGLALLGSTMWCLLLAAGLQWLLGVCRLGRLIRMVPHSVTAGFMAGIAVKLASTQLPHLLGTSNGQAWRAPALVVGAVVISVIVLLCARRRHKLAIPLGLLAGVVTHAALGLAGVATHAATLPGVDLHTVPMFHASALWQWLQASPSGAVLPTVLTFAVAIALINSMETLATGLAVEELSHEHFDADRALRAGALGSLASVALGGLPVAGGTAVSLAAHRAGARGRTAALLNPFLVLLVAVAGTPLLGWVPMAAVAAVLLAVSAQLVLPHLHELLTERRRALAEGREPGGDLAVAALVCVVLLFAGVGTALAAGVLAAAALVVGQMRARLLAREYWPGDRHGQRHVPANTCVLELAQPLFFATVAHALEAVERVARFTPHVVLDLTHGHAIDTTALRLLARCAASLKAQDCALALVVTEPVLAHTPRAPVQSTGVPTYPSVALALQAVHGCLGTPDQAPAGPLKGPLAAKAHRSLTAACQHETLLALSAVLGPIAKVLVQRASVGAHSREHLCSLLAADIESAPQRQAFLDQMGLVVAEPLKA
jgi:sulfate permease, SulP family